MTCWKGVQTKVISGVRLNIKDATDYSWGFPERRFRVEAIGGKLWRPYSGEFSSVFIVWPPYELKPLPSSFSVDFSIDASYYAYYVVPNGTPEFKFIRQIAVPYGSHFYGESQDDDLAVFKNIILPPSTAERLESVGTTLTGDADVVDYSGGNALVRACLSIEYPWLVSPPDKAALETALENNARARAEVFKRVPTTFTARKAIFATRQWEQYRESGEFADTKSKLDVPPHMRRILFHEETDEDVERAYRDMFPSKTMPSVVVLPDEGVVVDGKFVARLHIGSNWDELLLAKGWEDAYHFFVKMILPPSCWDSSGWDYVAPVYTDKEEV